MTTVWPALLPPWYLTTYCTRSPSRSVALPLPSSPHWAPISTMAGIFSRLSHDETPGSASATGALAYRDYPKGAAGTQSARCLYGVGQTPLQRCLADSFT